MRKPEDEEWEDKPGYGDDSVPTQHWMEEPRYKQLFNEIEDKISGVLGKGEFEWSDRRVFDSVFDQSTLLALHKLMEGGEIDTLDFPIARGKEAHVFHATSSTGPVAVKIFHTTNAVFKSLSKYIDGDPRFGGLKRRHREIVNVWVRKEVRNLRRCRRHGIPAPMPRANYKNVLIMDLIGSLNEPSPRLRDVTVPNVEKVFNELIKMISVMWQRATMVHSDFSEYNILWHEDEPWIIDVGQAVVEQHPSAREFLVRDVTRIVEWANRSGIKVDVAESLLRVIDDPAPELEPLPGLD